jgi:hypothetical protein
MINEDDHWAWVPTWWGFLLMALAVFRIWKLLAEDVILDRPRARLLRAGSWRPEHATPAPRYYRDRLATFLSCPWCVSFWVGLIVYLLWNWWPEEVLAVCTVFAISAVVGLLAHFSTVE